MAVHVELPGPAAEPWREAALELGIPLLATWHPLSVMAAEADREPLDRAMTSFLRGCQQVLAETPAIRRLLAGDGLLDVSLVSNGVDSTRFDPAKRNDSLRAAWGAGPQIPVVLHVGRLEEAKNLDLLVRTFTAVRHRHPAAKLVCAGAGNGADILSGAIPGLICPGFLTGEDLAEAYASADAFLFPSMNDAYGNVVLEAAASGLAIVAFDRAAAGGLLRGGAELVPEGDETAFTARAEALVGDPGALRRLGAAARKIAERLTWADTGRQFLSAVERAKGVPPRILAPGTSRVVATVRAILPDAPGDDPFDTVRLLNARGHRIAWHTSDQEARIALGGRDRSLTDLLAGLPTGDRYGAWSRRIETAEGRICAWAAGNEAPANPLRIAACLRAPRVANGAAMRFHHLVAGARAVGHAVQVQAETAATEPEPPPEAADARAERHRRLTTSLRVRWMSDRPDVVHVEVIDSFAIAVIEAAEALGIPWTTTWHPVADHVAAERRQAVQERVVSLARRAACVFGETPAQVAEVGAFGVRRAALVANGVDTRRFSPQRRDARLRAHWNCEIAVLAVGRLMDGKNCAALVEIARALRSVPGARLVVAGGGPELSALRAAAPEALWLGFVPEHALPAIYASADLFVFTSRVDGFGLVVPEALASGVPVVGFDRAGVAEMVDDPAAGVRVPLSGDLAAAVAERCRSGVGDPAAARAIALRWTWARAAARFAEELAACAGALPPRSGAAD